MKPQPEHHINALVCYMVAPIKYKAGVVNYMLPLMREMENHMRYSSNRVVPVDVKQEIRHLEEQSVLP
jgi:hypothetical protein